ncbi:hypothetical protein HMPREF1248_0594 [Coriobacteriaceae bacterium BV3Ac1]|nr:hypothetical protein HMPREF1248_0594 [Coriobacteriaceae bacterium BV3Ac1]
MLQATQINMSYCLAYISISTDGSFFELSQILTCGFMDGHAKV